MIPVGECPLLHDSAGEGLCREPRSLRHPRRTAGRVGSLSKRAVLRPGILTDRDAVASMGRPAPADGRERFDLPGFAARFEASYREVAAR